MSKAQEKWFLYIGTQMAKWELSKLQRWQRRLAVIIFPITLLAFICWVAFWVLIGFGGLAVIGIRDVWR